MSTRSTLPVNRWSTPFRIPSGCAVTALVAAARRSAAGEPLQDLVGEAVGGGERELERRGIGDARALEVARLEAALGGERPDLDRGAVDQHRADVQRPQHGDVHQDVAEVLVRRRRRRPRRRRTPSRGTGGRTGGCPAGRSVSRPRTLAGRAGPTSRAGAVISSPSLATTYARTRPCPRPSASSPPATSARPRSTVCASGATQSRSTRSPSRRRSAS